MAKRADALGLEPSGWATSRVGANPSGPTTHRLYSTPEVCVMADVIVRMWADLIDKYLARMPMRDRRERLDALEKALKLAKERYPL